MSFVLKSSDVPAGVYNAKFIGVERTTHAEFGGGLKFSFEIADGKYAGKTTTRTTGDKPTPRNVAGKVLAAIAGAKPSDGLSIDADEFIGKAYQVVVGETESGFTRVNEILPAKDKDVPF
jgi:hypothetical protein